MLTSEADADRLGPVDRIIVRFPGSDVGNGQRAPIPAERDDLGLFRIRDALGDRQAQREGRRF